MLIMAIVITQIMFVQSDKDQLEDTLLKIIVKINVWFERLVFFGNLFSCKMSTIAFILCWPPLSAIEKRFL